MINTDPDGHMEAENTSTWLTTNYIKHEDYDTVINRLLKEPSTLSFAQKALLNRIKDEDLPLFINYPWRRYITSDQRLTDMCNGERSIPFKEQYLNRLKG